MYIYHMRTRVRPRPKEHIPGWRTGPGRVHTYTHTYILYCEMFAGVGPPAAWSYMYIYIYVYICIPHARRVWPRPYAARPRVHTYTHIFIMIGEWLPGWSPGSMYTYLYYSLYHKYIRVCR